MTRVTQIPPQPVPYTGSYLQQLDRLCHRPINAGYPVLTFVFRRIMVASSLVRMVIDSTRYMSHAIRDCWVNKCVTQLAIDSLNRSTRHFILTILTLAFGFLSPSLIVKSAAKLAVLPRYGCMRTLLNTAKAITILAIVAALGCSLACVVTDRQAVVTRIGGEPNFKAASLAVTVFTAGSAVYGAIKLTPTILQIKRCLQFIWIIPYDFRL